MLIKTFGHNSLILFFINKSSYIISDIYNTDIIDESIQ